MLKRWTTADRDVIAVPSGLLENLATMLEEHERKEFERNSYDKFDLARDGSLELQYLKRVAYDISWSGLGNQ